MTPLALPNVYYLPAYHAFHPRDKSGHDTLTEMLITHFYHNYKLNSVQWPHKSSVAFRHQFYLPVADETQRVDTVNSLYEKPSNFRVRRSNATIGGGLCSCKIYEKIRRIATFNGNVLSSDMYEVEKQAEETMASSREQILF